MTPKRAAVFATALIAATAIGANTLPSVAHDASPQPMPIATEFLTPRSVFPDDVDLKLKLREPGGGTTVVRADDPSRTLVAKFTVQPGARFPWHTHPGPVIVNVTQGELVYVDAETCTPRAYPAGTAFVDAGHGHVHTAFNRTAQETVLIATFFEAPEEGPLLIPVEPPKGCTA
jgi:quercetin dioxygenase-like cupin family protein